ncbi:MAG TPA: chromate resistance protein ChrB domain-containing protein, partial [Thermoanaerobaculia bacterium]
AIAEIVHDLDLKEARYNRPETAGVRLMLDGLMARTENDEERLERSLVMFDDLHEALGRRRKGGRG